jgi:hypothetical protein
VTLAGAATAIPPPDTAPVVNFTWTLVGVPPGSALPAGPLGNTATITFTPDVAGPDPAAPGALLSYVIDLVVTQEVTPPGGGPNVVLSDTVRVTLT